MKRLTVHIFIVLLIFAIGAAVAAFWFTKREKFTFSYEVATLTTEGCFTEHIYETADGLDDVSYSKESYSSPALANEALGRIIERAAKIIERSPIVDRKDVPLGERVLLILRGETYAVFWTEGVNLHKIIGDSLSNVLDFEKSKLYKQH